MQGIERLVLATGNPGKLREIGDLLAPLSIRVIAQGELGIVEAEEPHDSFLENALAKARHASRRSGLPALADDSGLCVPALAGAPGVRSAVYAGEGGSREERDRANNAKLVRALESVADRRAYYACVMVLMRDAADPMPLVAEGTWAGELVLEPKGSNGFGYDPHFFLKDRGCTSAELDPVVKNAISHRGHALAMLIAKLGRRS